MEDGTTKRSTWLPYQKLPLPVLPSEVAATDILPLYVELNMDDFKITHTVVNNPTTVNIVFKGIPFDEQEKMKNIFLLGKHSFN